MRNLPSFPGWHLIGSFPAGDPDGVGSWLLHHGGEALLLEVPPGLTPALVEAALWATGSALRHITASHDHEDHLDRDVWHALASVFPRTATFHPYTVGSSVELSLGGEPLWLVKAPKHSRSDVVTVFRGVAMTGDIELGMLASVNGEVPPHLKRKSMNYLADFEERTGYRVHSVVSAHLNDVRTGVRWPDLFRV